MKAILIAAVLSALALPAYAQERISCVGAGGVGFHAQISWIVAEGPYLSAGEQFVITGLDLFGLPGGLKSYRSKELSGATETVLNDSAAGWAGRDAKASFALAGKGFDHGNVEITRPRGKNMAWKGAWTFSDGEELKVICEFRS
jgi:hypothetical protein